MVSDVGIEALGHQEIAIDPAWIDYNGHLRDGYYVLIASASIDALMDDLGMDRDYRSGTQCTLYTLEVHVRYLREIRSDARLCIDRYPAGFDAKRLRLLLALRPADAAGIAAVVDVMLMHVHQGADVRGTPFPADINQRLAAWHALGVPDEVRNLGSRAMALPGPSRP